MAQKDTSTPKKGPGRPKKSSTIKERAIYLYLPNPIMVKDWKDMAKKQNKSISKFVIEIVEEKLNDEGRGTRFSRKKLIDSNENLKAKVKELRQDLEIKSKAYHALDKELEFFRNQPFLNHEFSGERQISKELVNFFRDSRKVKYDDLLPGLEINPTNIEAVKAINNQIKILVQYGLIKQNLKGWEWVE